MVTIMQFIAKNPPSILILGGVLFGLIGGLGNIPFFLNSWVILLVAGFVLQVVWMVLNSKHKIF
jgi:hypothetical protein